MVTRRINSPNDHIQHPTGSSAYIRYPQALTARLLPPSPLTNTLPYYRQQYSTRPGPLRHSHTRPCPPFFFLFSSRRGGRGQELYQTWTTLLNWRPHTCLHASSPCFSPSQNCLTLSSPFRAWVFTGKRRNTCFPRASRRSQS